CTPNSRAWSPSVSSTAWKTRISVPCRGCWSSACALIPTTATWSSSCRNPSPWKCPASEPLPPSERISDKVSPTRQRGKPSPARRPTSSRLSAYRLQTHIKTRNPHRPHWHRVMDRYAVRRDRLHSLLAPESLDAFLISHPINVSYLTGFTGEASHLVVANDKT